MKRLLSLLSIMSIMMVTSCANPYAQFYRGYPDARTLAQYEPSAEPLKIYTTDNFDRDIRLLLTKGYFVIGKSSFNADGNAVTEAHLQKQAKLVGAQVVLVASHYTNTVSGAVPLVLPNTTTSYSSGSATVYGSGGHATAYGSGTTTTYGTQTVMMPYQTQRFDFVAVYLAKVKPRVGLYPKPLDDETRKTLGTNKGLIVDLVVEGSQAFMADILPGDILVSVAGQPVYSIEQYISLLRTLEGKTVAFEIIRNGALLQKQITVSGYK
jgi:hypothetical protein